MKLIKSLVQNYPDVIVTHFNFEKHVSKHRDINDTCLAIGYDCLWNENAYKILKNYEKRIFFNGEHPCSFTQEHKYGLKGVGLDEIFSDIYTICPYTAKWANDTYYNGREKFKITIFPIDKENVLKFNNNKKEYDAIFYGSICGKDHEETVNHISNFNYKFITLGSQYWSPNEPVDMNNLWSKVTDVSIPTFQKWEILSKTKVVPIFNQLYLKDNQAEMIKTYDGWEQNKAFTNIDQKIACQLKPRITEAAFFKMLMLVKKDPWNAIEFFYEPNKDFIYFDSNDELPDLIAETTTNWEKYQHIVESAYRKAMKNYTTEAVLERMIKETR
tara:strand:+ start:1558 stop:2544 length:987 start_codon:yes stop_codon:yes gene_type:complete